MNASPSFLNGRRCLLLVVDPQEGLMKAIEKADRVVRNCCLMIHCARTMDIPILATTQYRKGLGPLVPEIGDLLAGVPILDKTEFNAFANPGLQEACAGLPTSIDTVLLVGVEAHICIHQTALGALIRGWRPWVVGDAVSSREKRNAKAALRRMETLGAAVGPAEMAVYELLERAGTTAFKTMLPHLK